MNRRLQQPKPLSQSTINNILANNPSNKENQEQQLQPVVSANPNTITLSKQIEFDSLHPEENIKAFLTFSRNVISRFEDDQRRQQDLENRQTDIEHVMELSDNKDVVSGYRLYKKLADIRRERRACKSEIDLLKPLYDYLCSNNVMNDLSRLQGGCRISKETISKRQYTLRTDVI